jgi:hypothetical protein
LFEESNACKVPWKLARDRDEIRNPALVTGELNVMVSGFEPTTPIKSSPNQGLQLPAGAPVGQLVDELGALN